MKEAGKARTAKKARTVRAEKEEGEAKEGKWGGFVSASTFGEILPEAENHLPKFSGAQMPETL